MEKNAVLIVAKNIEEIFADGITGSEPIFNAEQIKAAALEELAKLKSLPEYDLSTEAGRKQLRAAIKPVKQNFTDFEKNIKVVKKAYGEIPKKCDAVSKAVRDIAEPEIARAELPFAELKRQEALTEKWWKKEGMPFDKYSLELLLSETRDSEPLPYSTEAEKADFAKYKGEYIRALEEALNRIAAAEKADKEEKERQAAEAERLRRQAEEQRRVAEEQRKAQAAIEAEQRRVAEEQKRIAAEAAELERQKQQAAVNPAISAEYANKPRAGAPPAGSEPEPYPPIHEAALSSYKIEAIHDYTLKCIKDMLDGYFVDDSEYIAEKLVEAIKKGEFEYVRFVYE